MDSDQTRTFPVSEILRQVADAMKCQQDETSATLPSHTTWRAAIRAAEAALENIDQPILLMPRKTRNRRALRNLARISALESSSEPALALPIRTPIEPKPVEPRRPLSMGGRERLRKMAQEMAKMEYRDPYVLFQSKLGRCCGGGVSQPGQ
ncbi:hypothetical protein BDV32DRAFT_67501 [Aspergillus pseudonomiae]|nr:hypothetical protein BDV32DRAFT_67501 [Aspergillus pseudonomiae]